VTPAERLTIAEAAVAWNVLRRVARHLKRERNNLSCDQDPAGWAKNGPCWKRTWVQTDEDDGEYRQKPFSEWCPVCLAREDAHAALRLVLPLRGIAARRLQMCAKGGWKA
jgi:hypothetical protein